MLRHLQQSAKQGRVAGAQGGRGVRQPDLQRRGGFTRLGTQQAQGQFGWQLIAATGTEFQRGEHVESEALQLGETGKLFQQA